MTFRVGQKVECINVDPHLYPCSNPDEYDLDLADLKVGEIYRVRWCKPTRRRDFGKFIGVRLVGIVRSNGDPAFGAMRFRPVIERKRETDISALTALLKPKTRELIPSVIGEDINAL